MAGTNGPKIVVTLWLLTIIPFFFMLLRFYCKKRYSRLFGWDDWLLGCSWVMILCYTSLIHVSVNYEIGKHFNDADPVQLVTGIKYMYVGELFALVAMPVGKTSFCVTLLRLSTASYQKWILWFIIITINLVMGAVSVMTFAQCTPVEKLWDLALPGECWDNRIVIYFSVGVGVYSCIMDFLLAICPYLLIHKLQMNRKEKFSIIAAMSIGCLAGVACAVKTAYLPLIGTWSDFTYNIAEVLIWGLTESSITIVAASVPFMRLIFKEITSSADRSYNMKHMYSRSFKQATDHGTKSKITTTNMEIYTSKKGTKEDDSSDKSILGESRGLGKIMQTYEVKVEFEESADDPNRDERIGRKV